MSLTPEQEKRQARMSEIRAHARENGWQTALERELCFLANELEARASAVEARARDLEAHADNTGSMPTVKWLGADGRITTIQTPTPGALHTLLSGLREREERRVHEMAARVAELEAAWLALRGNILVSNGAPGVMRGAWLCGWDAVEQVQALDRLFPPSPQPEAREGDWDTGSFKCPHGCGGVCMSTCDRCGDSFVSPKAIRLLDERLKREEA